MTTKNHSQEKYAPEKSEAMRLFENKRSVAIGVGERNDKAVNTLKEKTPDKSGCCKTSSEENTQTSISLCPAVQENIIRLQVMDEESGEVYAEHVRKNITAQAEWERERVKKAIDEIKSIVNGRNGDEKESVTCPCDFCYIVRKINEIAEKELGIEQEEKK